MQYKVEFELLTSSMPYFLKKHNVVFVVHFTKELHSE